MSFLSLIKRIVFRLIGKKVINPNQILTRDDHTYYTRRSIFYGLDQTTSKGKIVFLGDSLIHNCNWDEMFQNGDILNRGIGGDTTSGIIKRLDDIRNLQPRKVFISAGINDFTSGKTIGEIEGNYREIIAFIKKSSPKSLIFIHSILPINNELNGAKISPSLITDINKRIESLCKQQNIVFINNYPNFADSKGQLKEELTFDGVHPNGDGYLIWKKEIEKYVQL